MLDFLSVTQGFNTPLFSALEYMYIDLALHKCIVLIVIIILISRISRFLQGGITEFVITVNRDIDRFVKSEKCLIKERKDSNKAREPAIANSPGKETFCFKLRIGIWIYIHTLGMTSTNVNPCSIFSSDIGCYKSSENQ